MADEPQQPQNAAPAAKKRGGRGMQLAVLALLMLGEGMAVFFVSRAMSSAPASAEAADEAFLDLQADIPEAHRVASLGQDVFLRAAIPDQRHDRSGRVAEDLEEGFHPDQRLRHRSCLPDVFGDAWRRPARRGRT